MKHDTPDQIEERKRRINLTIWACSYEFYGTSIVSDAAFDEACLAVNLKVKTGRKDLDSWWKTYFSPYTGQWIHSHPELETHVKPLTEMVLGNRKWGIRELSIGRMVELNRRHGKEVWEKPISDFLEFE